MSQQSPEVDAQLELYRKIQEEVQELAAKRQQFAQQANENGMVKKELDLLDGESKVFKLIGGVLLKQDVQDAQSNVNKRIEFITNEGEKLNKRIEAKEAEAMKIRTKISTLQMEMQKAAAEAAQKVVASQ